MNKETAEKILNNWMKALIDESFQGCSFNIPFVKNLLEAQKVIERERAAGICDSLKLDPYEIKEAIDKKYPGQGEESALHCFPYNTALETAKQEILSNKSL